MGNLHPGKLLLASFRITDQGGDVEAEVADEREWVGRIHRQGGENRKYCIAEVVINPIPLGAIQLFVVKYLHPLLGQLGL